MLHIFKPVQYTVIFKGLNFSYLCYISCRPLWHWKGKRAHCGFWSPHNVAEWVSLSKYGLKEAASTYAIWCCYFKWLQESRAPTHVMGFPLRWPTTAGWTKYGHLCVRLCVWERERNTLHLPFFFLPARGSNTLGGWVSLENSQTDWI